MLMHTPILPSPASIYGATATSQTFLLGCRDPREKTEVLVSRARVSPRSWGPHSETMTVVSKRVL